RSHRDLHLSPRLRSDRAPTRLRLGGRRAVRIADEGAGRGPSRGPSRGRPLGSTSDRSDEMSNSFISAQIDDSGPSHPRALHVAQNPSPTLRRPRVRRGRTLLARPGNLLLFLELLLAAILWIYPFIWLHSASLKAPGEIFGSGLGLFPYQPFWDNYARAWTVAGYDRYFLNTIAITAGTVVLIVVRSALAGYVLGRYSFAGKKLLIIIFLVTFFLPEG